VHDVGCGTGTFALMLADPVDLATMTGNVAQAIVDPGAAVTGAPDRPGRELVFFARRTD
jgi:hypothetical protein